MFVPDIVIYHGDCDDGFGAAWVVRNSCKGANIQFVPAAYGGPLPSPKDVAGKRVLFVDFSASPAVLQDMAETAAVIVILDHHKTALDALAAYQTPWFDCRSIEALMKDRKIIAHFDMDRSGTMLAWRFYHGDVPAPTAIACIQDVDLWRMQMPISPFFSAAIRSYPQDFDVWDTVTASISTLIRDGVAIDRARRRMIENARKDAMTITVAGFSVPAMNLPYALASMAANELLQWFPQAPFAVAWFKDGQGKYRYSLRSEDHRQDVSEIAKQYGGGGHRNAAGMSLDYELK